MLVRGVAKLGAIALVVASGCAPVEVVDPATEAVDAAFVVEALPSPSPPSVPTTAPYAEPVRALPTPVDLPVGAGTAVPTVVATPSDPDAPPDETESSPAEPTVAPAPTEPSVAPTAEPTRPPPTATAQPSVPLRPFTPVTPSAEVEIANGAEGYSINCARCHSENGLGTFQASGLIGIGANSTRAGLIADLTNGHAFTFGFDELSAEEIAAVVAYVRATF